MRKYLSGLWSHIIWGTPEVPSGYSEVRRSLHISTWEGALATVHLALTQGVFLINYGQDIGLRDLGMGLLDAIPYLCQGFAFASPLIVARFGNRRQVALYAALGHRLVWVGLIALLWIPMDFHLRSTLLLTMMVLSYGLAAIGGNAWTGWMADLVPAGIRATYYGKRFAMSGGVMMVCVLLGTGFLDWMIRHDQLRWGYTILFSAGILSAFLTALLLYRQHEPPAPPLPAGWSMRRHVAKAWQDPGLRRLLPFIIIWQFFWGVSTSSFGLHMKQDLALTPFMMGVLATWGSLVALLATGVWGRVERRTGSRTVLVGCSVMIVAHLFTWLPATPSFPWPIFITVGGGGLCWSGFNLAWFNHTQTIGTRENRLATLAIIGVAFGVSYAIGSALAGVCNRITPHYLGLQIGDWQLLNYHGIIVLSAVGRLLAVLQLQRAIPGSASLPAETLLAWRTFLGRNR